MKKRFLSLALSAALTLSVLTPAAFAAEYVEIVPPKYDEIGGDATTPGRPDMFYLCYSDGLAVVRVGTKYGFIDTNGKEVVPPKYDYAYSFSEGLAMVELDDKCGYIDTNGKEVVPPKYVSAGSFSDGVAVVFDRENGKDGKYLCIDKTGNVLFEINYYGGATDFSQGVAVVASERDYGGPDPLRFGLIDKTGKELVPLKYSSIGYFYEGLAVVLLDSKLGYIDITGKEVIPLKYDTAEPFSDGLAKVGVVDSQSMKYGYIDTTGKEVIPCQYDFANFSDGLVKVSLGDKTSYFDKTGKEATLPTKEDVISPSVRDKYNSVGSFSEGLAAVSVGKYPNTKYGFIDTTGKEVVPPKYDRVESFSEGLAAVCLGDQKNGKWGFIDATGKEVVPLKYDLPTYAYPDSFSDGLAKMALDGKWGYIDKTGKEVVPFQYSSISATNVDGLMVVRDENRKEGLIRISTSTPAPTVPPSPCAVTLDGKAITLNAYLFTENGGGSNYVMLRDIAMLLNGTKAQFDVSWAADVGITITTGSAYTPVGGELQGKGEGEKSYTANSSTITVDGKPVSLGGYTIESNNYFKLRDLGTALGFTVDWDAATGTVVLSTNG